MIASTALRLAGPGHALMGARRGGVAHVADWFSGELGSAICGTWILCSDRRRLMPLDLHPEARRMCRRCVVRLSRCAPRRGSRAPSSRTDLRTAHEGTTPRDVAFALELATTPAEVDAAAHLSLALFDSAAVAAKAAPVWAGLNLAALVHRHRQRVGGFAEYQARSAELRALAEASAIARRKADAAERRDNRNRTTTATERSRP